MTATVSTERCPWAGDGEMRDYHDNEWGVPQRHPAKLFEFLILEGAQAGLSWQTILNKRENYRRAFEGFDAERVAAFDDERIAALMADPGIVRNRLKVNGAVRNARAWLALDDPAEFVWSFVEGVPQVNSWREFSEVPATTEVSAAMSKAMAKQGFTFVGPTIMYSLMQACGLVNDHLVSCHYRVAGS